jgi:hypothetical protein
MNFDTPEASATESVRACCRACGVKFKRPDRLPPIIITSVEDCAIENAKLAQNGGFTDTMAFHEMLRRMSATDQAVVQSICASDPNKKNHQIAVTLEHGMNAECHIEGWGAGLSYCYIVIDIFHDISAIIDAAKKLKPFVAGPSPVTVRAAMQTMFDEEDYCRKGVWYFYDHDWETKVFYINTDQLAFTSQTAGSFALSLYIGEMYGTRTPPRWIATLSRVNFVLAPCRD